MAIGAHSKLYSVRVIIWCCFVVCIIQVVISFLKHSASYKNDSPYGLFAPQTVSIVHKNASISVNKEGVKFVTSSIVDVPEKEITPIGKDMDDFIPIAPFNATINDALPHPHAGARFQNGSLGYVADPTALRRSVQSFSGTYFHRIVHLHERYRKGTLTETVPLTPDFVCNLGPGRSYEDEGGFKLLTEKIRVSEPVPDAPRILCSIYTYTKMRDLARIQALSWGHECDGFLAFSTETIPELGILEILHSGEESYQNMWQKVRSIWAYIHDHYLEDFDWFHLGGDDLYIIVENLRRFLKGVDERKVDPNEPLFLGSVNMGPPFFVVGAPGYTMNRHALSRFVSDALPICKTTHKVSMEDRLITGCFIEELNITPGDTRDYATGEPQYHDCNPHHLFTFRTGFNPSFHSKIAKHWENLTHPSIPNQLTGPKHALEAAAKYSVSFHDIFTPTYVARIHALIYPESCPSTSVLGRALRHYGFVAQ